MILVTGSLAFDVIFNFPGKFAEQILPDKLHILSVSFLVHQMRKGMGGTAGNIAYTLNLLGIKTGILAAAGSDFATYRIFLEEHRINTKYIKIIPDNFSSQAFGITDNDNNQIWGYYAGADSYSDNPSIENVGEEIDFAIIAPQNHLSMLKFARECIGRKIPYLFDPGMQLPWFAPADLKKALEGARIIIGNDYEICLMEKKLGIDKSGRHYGNKDKIIITTLGEKGSVIDNRGKTIKIVPVKAESVTDPAGAGDAYRAGFMAGYLRDLGLEKSGRMGSVAAVYTVEKYGTTTHIFSKSDFCERYRRNFREKLEL